MSDVARTNTGITVDGDSEQKLRLYGGVNEASCHQK